MLMNLINSGSVSINDIMSLADQGYEFIIERGKVTEVINPVGA